MPSASHRITGLTLDGTRMDGVSGELSVRSSVGDASNLDVGSPDTEQDIESRRSWDGRLTDGDLEAIHRMLADAPEDGVRARFILEGDIPVEGYITLAPAYRPDEDGTLEFQGSGGLQGIEFPNVNR